ncbi:MAG TPA: potassium-transporting ATPase subunit KdpA [Pirellulales bacterium]|nr:potassium-transporting ATPase subunit KdpA [Pirellulales bacterium]
MTANGWSQLVLYVAVLLLLAKPLGSAMAAVYEGRRTWLDPVFGPLERLTYRICRIDPTVEMRWTTYSAAVLWFSLISVLAVYGLQRLQVFLPLNPERLGPVSADSSFNTAVSFATNTNWQGYGGEVTMSYLTQMAGLCVQNFVSAAAGMAVLIAFIRGFTRRSVDTIGNFWFDLVRSAYYIVLPLSIALALLLVSQGLVQSFGPYKTVPLLQATSYDQPKVDKDGKPVVDSDGQPVTEKIAVTEQVLPMGPVASQIAIKQLGTNGGGFFNVNSCHPFENSTPLSNLLSVLSILVTSAALCYTFGVMVKDTRQGWAILAAMTILFVALLVPCVMLEQRGTPQLAALGADLTADNTQSGGNMEGKETRFGIVNSALWATATTCASNGSVNSMHDSYTPLAGAIPMWLMQLGEVVYGGVGCGLYGMLLFVIVAVFIAGLMVGRTPEYLGKKIEAYEMKMASIGILVPCAVVLLGTALAVVSPQGKATIFNPSTHGFSEVLYAYSSAGNNNGSAFAGINVNTPFYNTTLGMAMLFARFWIMVPTLAIAGSLAKKKIVPVSAGTMPTHTPLFVALLISVVIIVGALTFFPALALGPIAEELTMHG